LNWQHWSINPSQNWYQFANPETVAGYVGNQSQHHGTISSQLDKDIKSLITKVILCWILGTNWPDRK